MATPTPTHAEPVNDEKPTQGIFIGWLALALIGVIAIALVVALLAAGRG